MNNFCIVPDPANGRYVVKNTYIFRGTDWEVSVLAGFSYDGATIPRLTWAALYSKFDPKVVKAAAVHDWLYYTHQYERKKCDEIFKSLLKRYGVPLWKRAVMHRAVRMFGGIRWENTEAEQIYIDTLRSKHVGKTN